MRTIAVATSTGGMETDLLTPLSDVAKTLLKQLRRSASDKIEIFTDPDKNPLAREMLQFHCIKATSLLNVPLIARAKMLGGLVFVSKGKEKPTESHARLMSLLKEPFTIAVSNALEHRDVLRMKSLLAENNRFLRNELRRETETDIIGADFGLKNVMDMVRQVAPLESPVFIHGETGTGKEMIAAAVHNLSKRREGPFVKVNCGAIPNTLIDSELFGHEKGAFTGAVDKKIGRFERANQGTIFLDEVGEFPLEAQVRLLRVLQEKEIERVGGSDSIKMDIRVIAATHRDLKTMIEEGTFREDLYFRLQIFPIELPPLRERVGDIPALVQHFIRKKTYDMKLSAIPELAPDSMSRLMAYRWPGNVRELENALERSLILNQGEPLKFPDLQPDKAETVGRPAAMEKTPLSMNLDGTVIQHISMVLEFTGGKVEGKGGAAELLGVNPGTLRNRMRKLGIPFGRKTNQESNFLSSRF
ncbi:MAG: sigma-54-dependent Fis family transcriptional regulator [Proteobacteria bacterium]|nr:sigma-54-dependent Fis family transcriptional regulator [Pseudomonadota bacterium]